MRRSLATRLAMVAALAALSASAGARQQCVTSVEVRSTVPRIRDALRASVEQEVNRVDWSRVQKREHVVLSTSVLKLDTTRDGAGIEVSCLVAITVRNAAGALRAVVEGRAKAEGHSAVSEQAELGALDAAARGAVRGVPSALLAAK